MCIYLYVTQRAHIVKNSKPNWKTLLDLSKILLLSVHNKYISEWVSQAMKIFEWKNKKMSERILWKPYFMRRTEESLIAMKRKQGIIRAQSASDRIYAYQQLNCFCDKENWKWMIMKQNKKGYFKNYFFAICFDRKNFRK